MTNVLLDKKLLHRYNLRIVKDFPTDTEQAKDEKVREMEVIASFYRGVVDPAYQAMMQDLIDSGLFDDFISAVLQGLVHQGKVLYYVFVEHVLCISSVMHMI